jgi:predicted RNA-binding Zn-ribbon protein involved in translation (DUF1610 family)
MQHRSSPTQPETPTPPAVSPFALHLLHGWWAASCPDCGHELGRSRDQAKAEQAGERRRCPICPPEQPDRHARPAFLVAWLTANGLDQEEAAS